MSGYVRVVGMGGREVLGSKLGECKKKELFFEKFDPIYGGKKPSFLVLYYRRFLSIYNDGNLPFYDGFTFSDTLINGGNETAVNDALTAVLTAVFVTAVNSTFNGGFRYRR